MRVFVLLLGWLRRKPTQPGLDEDAAYARCHGTRNAGVANVRLAHRNPRLLPHLTGSYLRRCFEERLEDRRAAHT